MFYRRILTLSGFLLLIVALAVPAGISAQDDTVDVYGRKLPADAAPYSMQIWTELCDSTRKETTLSAAVSVYQRICGPGVDLQLGDPLLSLDENLNLIPASAEKWEASKDGLTWTFK